MPTGATPGPMNPATGGTRTLGDWDFHYTGWKRDFQAKELNVHHLFHTIPQFRRSGGVKENVFPIFRKGCLSDDILTHLGCSANVMKDPEGFPDALFFYQLLLPVCDTSKNDNDPCMLFYSVCPASATAMPLWNLDWGQALDIASSRS
jgi:hypothetical protein